MGNINPEFLIMIPVLLFSISLHEYAHGLAAKWGGDLTAQAAGRLTLNPIAHIDPVGTIFVPFICMIMGGFFIGWAKPVPVNPNNFRKSSWNVVVSIAGPLSNFFLVVIFVLLFKATVMSGILFSGRLSPNAIKLVTTIMVDFIVLNVLLGLFNLIPIPPLDGSHIFYHYFVRPHTRDHVMFKVFEFMQRFGFLLLFILIFGIPGRINPFYRLIHFTLKIIDFLMGFNV